MTTTATTTRVSLRDISEVAYRCLRTHGATHGEARAAAEMVLQAELAGGGGLTALLGDLGAPSWVHEPLELSAVSDRAEGRRASVVLGSPDNRVLRVAPLAVELVASGDARVVAVPLEAVGPSQHGADPVDLTLLDAVTLELARVCGVGIAVVACPSARVRWARPDGSIGAGTLKSLSTSWQQMLTTPGLLALRDVAALREVDLTWVSADDRALARAVAGSTGVTVDASLWQRVKEASRGFLVPEG